MYTMEAGRFFAPTATTAIGSLSLTAGAVVAEYVFFKRCNVKRLLALVGTAPTVTDAVVTFRRRLAPGVAGGQTTIGTLTLAVATAAGKCVYKDIEETTFEVGDSLAIEVTTTSTAGAAHMSFEADLKPEDPRNEADMVISL